MSTFTQSIHHIIYSTYCHKPILAKNKRQELFRYIWGILKNNSCHLYRINGVEDHIHILTHIHPTVSVAGLVKDIKLASSQMIKNEKLFKGFNGWQKGYGAFTYSFSAKDSLIEYIKNQERHHRKTTFVEELIEILNKNGVKYDPKYLT